MYGAIFKRIRNEKGLTQKEIYSGVVSKSFYSDFEAGKHAITVDKFERLLQNLGISYDEFVYYQNSELKSPVTALSERITTLYERGAFEELYHVFQDNYASIEKPIRQLAVKAYLLVLITPSNFYKFSRDPFNEIVADLEGQKMWNLESIRLAKLVLLSLSENQKKAAAALVVRITKELEKYADFDKHLYFEEIGDLYFNHIQSLLITNDISQALALVSDYHAIIGESNDLHLLIQLKFIQLLTTLYTDFPGVIADFDDFIKEMLKLPASEPRFYEAIGNIHREKAKNYYLRGIGGRERRS